MQSLSPERHPEVHSYPKLRVPWHCALPSSGEDRGGTGATQRGWAQKQLQREREREKGEGERDIDTQREREFTDKERDAQGGETRAMFGMIKNSLFGNTEKTEYKLLSSETKVRGVRAELPVGPDTHSTLGFGRVTPCFLADHLQVWQKARLTLDLSPAVIVTPSSSQLGHRSVGQLIRMQVASGECVCAKPGGS